MDTLCSMVTLCCMEILCSIETLVAWFTCYNGFPCYKGFTCYKGLTCYKECPYYKRFPYYKECPYYKCFPDIFVIILIYKNHLIRPRVQQLRLYIFLGDFFWHPTHQVINIELTYSSMVRIYSRGKL
jgi:hypothetical protein